MHYLFRINRLLVGSVTIHLTNVNVIIKNLSIIIEYKIIVATILKFEERTRCV